MDFFLRRPGEMERIAISQPENNIAIYMLLNFCIEILYFRHFK